MNQAIWVLIKKELVRNLISMILYIYMFGNLFESSLILSEHICEQTFPHLEYSFINQGGLSKGRNLSSSIVIHRSTPLRVTSEK